MASKFVRVSTQFIAALGNPGAKTGAGACKWGIWREDPGPRGIHISDWEMLNAKDGVYLQVDGFSTKKIDG